MPAFEVNSNSRLIAFGCSHTVGEYLPGWQGISLENNWQVTFSDDAWPFLLAKKLGISQVINTAIGGNSNHEIMLQILDFDFQPNDIAVVCWSHANREIIFDPEIYAGKFSTITILLNQDDKKYRFYQAHSILDLEIRSREFIQHSELHLKNKNIKYIMGRIENWQHNEQWKDNSYDHFPYFEFIDFALDGAHPGIESHKVFADKLYEQFQ